MDFEISTGSRYGKLTAVSLSEKTYGKSGGEMWFCWCDCGGEKHVSKYHLSKETVTHCGCDRMGPKHRMWSGYKEINNSFWKSIRSGAVKRGLTFDLRIEDAWELYLMQFKTCAISGVEIFFRHKSRQGEQTASLDRIDSDLGYSIENVQWVHKLVNKMKWDLPDSDFLGWCKKITEHNAKYDGRIIQKCASPKSELAAN